MNKTVTKNKTYMFIVAAAFIMLASMMISITAKADGFTGWSNGYYFRNGEVVKNQAINEGGYTYYVDGSGKAVTGWANVGGRYYFFNEEGKNYKSGFPIGAVVTQLSSSVKCMGLDMSKYQGNVNWNYIKASGVSFVMLRVGYGKGRFGNSKCEIDEKFYEYVRGASAAGIPIGVYFYSYATTANEAIEEAEFTIKALDGVPISFPVAYDIEDAYIKNSTDKATRTNMVKSFCDVVYSAGYTPMYYCNKTWYDTYLDKSKLGGYEFWYARYTWQEPNRGAYPCGMWQATSTQRVPGIYSNTVDVDFLYNDYFTTAEKRNKCLKHGFHYEGLKYVYYFRGAPSGNGVFNYGDNTYLLHGGVAYTGWLNAAGKTYFFDKYGRMAKGFTTIGSKLYWFGDDGALVKHTTEPGISIAADGSCKVVPGFYATRAGYVYRLANGQLAKNRVVVFRGKIYYMNAKGLMHKGALSVGKNTFYFGPTGAMHTGWLRLGGRYYFFWRNGVMIKNAVIPAGGKRYYFNSKGQLIAVR